MSQSASVDFNVAVEIYDQQSSFFFFSTCFRLNTGTFRYGEPPFVDVARVKSPVTSGQNERMTSCVNVRKLLSLFMYQVHRVLQELQARPCRICTRLYARTKLN